MDSSELYHMWEGVCSQVKSYSDVDASQVNAFFSRLAPQAMSEGFLMLTADNDFIKGWVERRYLETIKQALNDLYHVPFTVLIEVDAAATESAVAAAAASPAPPQTSSAAAPAPSAATAASGVVATGSAPVTQTAAVPATPAEPATMSTIEPVQASSTIAVSAGQTNEPQSAASPSAPEAAQAGDAGSHRKGAPDGPASLTFENFVIGDSNRMAYSMAVAVAETPGKAHLNPLFIYGKSGLGKTHLLRAIQNYIRETQPNLTTVYVDSAELLSDYMEASAAHDKEKSSYKNFKNRYEEADVLLIDDVQYLQGKKQTLDIMFQIFNKLTGQDKQVVLSADRRFAYITNHFSDVVTVLELGDNRVVTTIPVGDGPHSLEVSPDGTRIALVNYISDDLMFIDPATNTVVGSVPEAFDALDEGMRQEARVEAGPSAPVRVTPSLDG